MTVGGLRCGRVRVVVEPKPSGTGGALISAQEIIAPRFLLLNGDSLFDINLRALAAEASAEEALIALHRFPTLLGTERLNSKAKKFSDFVQKAQMSDGPALINAGIYALRHSIIHCIGALPCSIELTFSRPLRRKNNSLELSMKATSSISVCPTH